MPLEQLARRAAKTCWVNTATGTLSCLKRPLARSCAPNSGDIVPLAAAIGSSIASKTLSGRNFSISAHVSGLSLSRLRSPKIRY